MTWGVIATWRMAHNGLLKATKESQQGGVAGTVVEQLIKEVEDCPFHKSMGCDGLPSEEGILEMGVACMDGDISAIGAVAGVTDVKNPIPAVRALNREKFNSSRVGAGTTKYSMLHGSERRSMLTERANQWWQKRLKEIQENQLNPYNGHGAAGAITLDQTGSIAAGTSSSGFFMKKAGHVDNSPLSGPDFYIDNEIGGAVATGLGEDLMKGYLSYEIVHLMGEGHPPQQICNQAVYVFHERLTQRYGKAGTFSLVAMNKQEGRGVATNVEFTFTAGIDAQQPKIYITDPDKNRTTGIQPTSQEWLAAYEKRIKALIE